MLMLHQLSIGFGERGIEKFHWRYMLLKHRHVILYVIYFLEFLGFQQQNQDTISHWLVGAIRTIRAIGDER